MKNIKGLFVKWWSAIVPAFYGGMKFLTVTTAYAVSAPPQAPVETESELAQLMCNIIGWFFWIVLVISVIMVLFAAFTYVTARDDSEKTSKARKTLTYAAIGIAIAIIAAGFPSIVSSVFPGEPGVSIYDTCTF